MLATTHGGDLYGFGGRVGSMLIRAVVRRASIVTAVNDEMRERLIGLGADPDRTLVLPMGADVAAVRAVAGLQRRLPRRLLFVGRLVEKKGLTVLLQALKLLDCRDLHVVVVGDGPLRAELERQAAGAPVSFLGALGSEAVAAQYGQASVAVFPSVRAASGDQDGLPVALLEAMAAGCTVVGSDLPGIRNVVEDGVTGLLVPSGDPAALAAALTRALDARGAARQMGEAAAMRSERHSVEVVGERYVGLLERVRLGGA